MNLDKPILRMTLRELMTYAAKSSQDLSEQLRGDVLPRLAEFRDLSRPVRRRSQYPTHLAMRNALAKLDRSQQDAVILASFLREQLQLIREKIGKETTGAAIIERARESA